MAASAERMDGQRKTRAHCCDRRPRETGRMELCKKGRAWSGVCGRRRDGQMCMRAGIDGKILMTGGGNGVQQSASRRSTVKSHWRTTCPEPRYSRHPPVPAHSQARPSVPLPFPIPFRRLHIVNRSFSLRLTGFKKSGGLNNTSNNSHGQCIHKCKGACSVL